MIPRLPDVIDWLLGLSIAGYAVVAMLATIAWPGRRRRADAASQRPVSILKPLHGSEPELLENLRSFCIQDYPDYQVIFGLRDASDPALQVVERLRNELPHSDLTCVINPATHGSNNKVSNLINMLPAARHPWLVLADSDIRVSTDYLRSVTAALPETDTGISTCLYKGRPCSGLWSRLGAMFIDQWFAPSVLVSRLFGSSKFAFGATIALRRETLDAIGGFESLASHLADDYRLGELTRARGLKTVLSDYTVETTVAEPNVRTLVRHELRWLRTIRTVQPAGYAMMFVSFGLPLSIVLALVPGSDPLAAGFLLVTAAARAVLHYCVELRSGNGMLSALSRLPLVPLRDALILCVWLFGFTSRSVDWSGRNFTVAQDGSLRSGAR